MKQENNMKREMNQVNPKAGTLKQNMINWSNIKTASRKLIASIMMLAIIVMTPGVIQAKPGTGDTCCTLAETTRLVKLVKAVKLSLPSSELVKKADIEAHRNLVKSLTESKMKQFSAMFATSDNEINRSFRNETTISLPVAREDADITVTTLFQAENIKFDVQVANSDTDIRDIFQAENQGIIMNVSSANADDQITTNFLAENITLPSAEVVTKADTEINNRLENDNLRFAVK